jgi:hypothetical protein
MQARVAYRGRRRGDVPFFSADHPLQVKSCKDFRAGINLPFDKNFHPCQREADS